MITKHTSGPWEVIITAHRTLICATFGDRVAECESLSSDDARLIAAAPDLLEALKSVMAGVAGCERDPHWEAARAAIAKATEGQ